MAREALTLARVEAQQGSGTPWAPPAAVLEIRVRRPHPVTGERWVVRSLQCTLTLPESGLFTLQLQSTGPLVTTDSRLSRTLGLSSLESILRECRLLSPLPRHYGDAFAQQQALRDQVIALTGRYFLAGYRSDAEQQQALVTASIAAAKRLALTPGKALTKAE